MKRHNDLLIRILTRDNFRLAFWKASRNKRSRDDIRKFSRDLERNLGNLRSQLGDLRFTFGVYRQFKIRDPKPRLITAPCFPERVVHHAIMNVCEPFMDRQLIDDTYACRVGKGREVCLERAMKLSSRFSEVVHLDISRYFDSISHEILLRRLGRLFKDSRLLMLFRQIVDTYQVEAGRGVPIGTLCSQHFANLYLADLDRHIKETLKLPGYVRYMDDFVLWSDNRVRLGQCVGEVERWLTENLALRLKSFDPPHGSRRGFDFLGHRVFPDRLTLNRRSRRRFRARLVELEAKFAKGEVTSDEYHASATSLTSFAANRLVSSWKARSETLSCVYGGGPQVRMTGQPGRQLEQHGQELPLGVPEQELAGQPEQQPGLPPSSASEANAWS